MLSFSEFIVEYKKIEALPDEVLKAAYKLRSGPNKLTQLDIAAKLGYDHSFLRKHLDSEENKKRPDYVPHNKLKSKNPDDFKAEVLKHHASGLGYTDIANKMGVKRGRIAGIVHRNKLAGRTK